MSNNCKHSNTEKVESEATKYNKSTKRSETIIIHLLYCKDCNRILYI